MTREVHNIYTTDHRTLVAAARRANDNNMKEVSEWARIFAHENRSSRISALSVLAGVLDDPAMLRRMADRLEGLPCE